MEAQQQVVLSPVKDNSLYETTDGSTSNGAGDYLFVGRVSSNGGGAKRRALMKFNLGASIPAGATVSSVTLTMNMSKTISGAETIVLHKLKADWGEGTSNAGASEGKGAAATTGDATWLHRSFNTLQWTSAGGDYETTVSGSTSVNGTGSYTWNSTAQLVSDAQSWVDNSAVNFGWILIGDESAAGTSKRFDSRENPTAANRPKLTIVYTTSTSAADRQITPQNFILDQNYPNPFNPSTRISYQLPAAAQTRLEIYNILGIKVTTLVDGNQNAGLHSVSWEAAGLSSGLYIYTLRSGAFQQTKTMMLVR
jgi:hypothetical protein